MNLIYMKYAMEVAACGSINKAAERLFIGQPNLSRAIKELESSLGVSIFERSPHGMRLTPDGEKFMEYAEAIIRQVNAVESMFRHETISKERFSISVPRASYIAEAFAAFAQTLADRPAIELFYQETNSMVAISNILQQNYKLGVIRYAESYDKYYKSLLDEKGLDYELITEFQHVLLMSGRSPLAEKSSIDPDDLVEGIEIAHADPYVPSLPLSEVKKEELPDAAKRIFVFERASQLELLSQEPNTFMWVSPMPPRVLERYGLVQRPFAGERKTYKDVIIHPADYRLTDLDNAFIFELCRVKRQLFEGI